MSSRDECKNNHKSQCKVTLDSCSKDAVFTYSQTEKIVQIASALDQCIIDAIENNVGPDYSDRFERLEREVRRLSEDLKKVNGELNCLESVVDKLDKRVDFLDSKVEKLDKRLDTIECELNKLSDRVAHALISQAEEIKRLSRELDQLQCEVSKLTEKVCRLKEGDKYDDSKLQAEICALAKRVKALECMDYKDERIDQILCMLADMVTRCEFEKLECDLRKLEKTVRCLSFKDERIEDILRRLACLEAKDWRDKRVDELVCKVRELEKRVAAQEAVNFKQQKSIDTLYCLNVKQEQEIKCLNEKLCALSEKVSRNDNILDSKINCVAKEEADDKRVDACQSAQIRTLNELVKDMQCQINVLTRNVINKPGQC